MLKILAKINIRKYLAMSYKVIIFILNLNRNTMKEFYYDVHVFFSRQDGYSVPVKSEWPLDEEETIELARENNLFTEDGDGYNVDYVEEINEETYKALGGK